MARKAIVTGGTRGIGHAIVLALKNMGCSVAATYVGNDEAAAKFKEETGVNVYKWDVGDYEACKAGVAEIEAAQGSTDILVNNAGITRPQPLEQIREEDWDELIAVNLKSAFLATQRVLPGMRARRWGRIINVSSVAAQTGGVVGPHYAASKAGMQGLTHFYAALLACEGITVNSIAPALVATEMVTSNPRARKDLIPAGRFGRVEEVAEVAVMLAANGYITGQTFNVNGGWYFS